MVAVRHYWFKAKKYGWGWSPASWQGWVLVFSAAVGIVYNFYRIDNRSHSVSDTLFTFIPETLVVIAVLILVACVTGEKPRWRWGDRDE